MSAGHIVDANKKMVCKVKIEPGQTITIDGETYTITRVGRQQASVTVHAESASGEQIVFEARDDHNQVAAHRYPRGTYHWSLWRYIVWAWKYRRVKM